MTITSTDPARLAAAVGRHLRAMAARFRRFAELEECATAQDISYPELYGLSTPRDSAGIARERLNKCDVAAEHGKSAQAYLPIGPSCC